jgi:hypothetical protein
VYAYRSEDEDRDESAMAKMIKLSSGETIRLLDCDPVRNPICMDCGVNLDAIDEDVMLVDDVWLAAVPTETGMLCIGCLEKRLGRKLRRDDFTRHSQSAADEGMPVSDRLKDWSSQHEK